VAEQPEHAGSATLPRLRAAVITVSDTRARGVGDDRSGDLIEGRLRTLTADPVARHVVPDDVDAIRSTVGIALDEVDLVVLTGGTGIAPRDVTPQALAPLLEYEIAGMAEAMRAAGLRSTPHAMLSRQVVGVVRSRLVMALPGNPRAVAECLEAVWPALPHAFELLRGQTHHHGAPSS
jgi:molybdenum cofactor synthesis domain-containing protein